MWINDAGALLISGSTLDRTPEMNRDRNGVRGPIVGYVVAIGAKPLKR